MRRAVVFRDTTRSSQPLSRQSSRQLAVVPLDHGCRIAHLAAQASLKTAITHANSTIFVLTTNHLSKVDQGIRDRSVLVEMNQPKPADCRLLGQRILQRMGLRGDEVNEVELDSFAAASRGSIRDFGSAVAIRGIAVGGVI
jgi:DNA polymerase III delta prime subunit